MAGGGVLRHVAGAAPTDVAVTVGEKTDGAEHCSCDAARVRDAFDDSGGAGGEVEEENDGGGEGSGWRNLVGVIGVVEDGNGKVGGG